MEYDYWDERFLLLNEMLLQQGEEYAQNAARAYMLAMLEIEKDINHFYARFANENSMTYQQAKQLLTSEQRQAFQMELEEYIAYGQQNNLDDVWIKKLENASTVHRITRLQAIQYQLQQQVEKLEAQKIKGITETLKNIYKEGYYRTAYEIQKGTGIGQAFSKIDENKIDKVLARAWAPDGKNFSERVWGTDRTQLIYQLQTRFTQGIIRGEGSQKIIKDMSKALYSSRKATERLVLTESAFVASASRKDTYENLGVKQYKVLATLDIKTSEMCRKLDGKVFDLKDYKIGLTANPFHPRCRSTTVPNIDSKYIQNQQRAARNKEGKTYYVPSDITYEQWHKTYVEADPEWLLQEKKHQNKNADKKQYEQYKAVLGKKEVGSFDNFQNMKYGDSEKWENLKQKRKDTLKNVSTNDKIKEKKEPFVPAKTIEEADSYAMNVLGIKMASYKGVDITTANEWNRGLKDTFDRFPELKQNFGFVGECHERNAAMEKVIQQQYLNELTIKYPKMSKQNLMMIAEKKAKKQITNYTIKSDVGAISFSPPFGHYLYDFRGVTVNSNLGSNSTHFIERLRATVENKYHPLYCDTIRYVLDHEVGHQLDVMLSISEQKNIQKLFDSMDNETITNELSQYAWDNRNKKRYAEFIAEGWAEYCNNPKPRKVAKEIGQTVERRYTEWIKRNS